MSELIARLEGVIPAGDGKWSARCPAHDDKSPSLSVRDDGDRVLIHCHAGCATEDVLAAVGLTFRDLYSDEAKAAYRSATGGSGRMHKDLQRMAQQLDPLDIERAVLRIAAEDIEAGRQLTVEDRARVSVARARLGA